MNSFLSPSEKLKSLLAKHAGDYKHLHSWEVAAVYFYREIMKIKSPSQEDIQLVVDLLHGKTCGCKVSHASNS